MPGTCARRPARPSARATGSSASPTAEETEPDPPPKPPPRLAAAARAALRSCRVEALVAVLVELLDELDLFATAHPERAPAPAPRRRTRHRDEPRLAQPSERSHLSRAHHITHLRGDFFTAARLQAAGTGGALQRHALNAVEPIQRCDQRRGRRLIAKRRPVGDVHGQTLPGRRHERQPPAHPVLRQRGPSTASGSPPSASLTVNSNGRSATGRWWLARAVA